MPIINLDLPRERGAVVAQPSLRLPYDHCKQDANRWRHCRRAMSIVARQGMDARVNDGIPLRVVHRENVQRHGQDGELVFDRHQISFNAEDGGFIRVGHTLTLPGYSLTFKTPLVRNKAGVDTWLCV